MKKQKGLLRRTVAGVAICAMLTGLLPGQAIIVRADSVDKYNSTVTSVGVSGIHNPQTAANVRSPWTGDYVYYGGHLFRVLDTDTTDFSTDDGMLPQKHTMLLDSDSVLGEHIHFDNDAQPNSGAERASEWEYSDLKTWLNDQSNGFLKQFSKAEIKGIASSTKPDPVRGDGEGYPNMRYAPLKDDKVFVLDAVEASREDYGYRTTTGNVTANTDALSRVKTSDGSYETCTLYDDVGDSGIWWLRSPLYSPKYPQYAGFVYGVSATSGDKFYGGGYFATNIVSYSGRGPSPALNVDLDSVLLSTRVKGDGSDYGNEYKLTLIYDKLEIAIPQGNISINENNNVTNVTVDFTVVDKYPNDGIEADCVSVLVVNGDITNGTIKKYDKLTSSLSFTNGEATYDNVTFTLPDGYNSETDHIYIFAEDTNEATKTDYASAPLALMQPGEANNLCYDGTNKSLLNNTSTIPNGYNAVYALSESAPAEGSYSAKELSQN